MALVVVHGEEENAESQDGLKVAIGTITSSCLVLVRLIKILYENIVSYILLWMESSLFHDHSHFTVTRIGGLARVSVPFTETSR